MPDPVPHFNIGAGQLRTEAGRDQWRSTLRRVMAECKKRLDDTDVHEVDHYALQVRIAQAEQLLDKLATLKYRNGVLVPPEEYR
jgi:hypothetical protein